MDNYIVTELKCFEHLFKLDRFFLSPFIFRGQANTHWKLKTSLFRSKENLGIDLEFIGRENDEEIAMLQEFKRKYNLYAEYRPDNKDFFEWLAIMQHYGAPTRLLDFTKSFFVALYFATKDLKKPWDGTLRDKNGVKDNIFSVYCVNKDKLENRINKLFLEEKNFEDENGIISHVKIANHFIENGNQEDEIRKLVIPLDSQLYTDRLSRQQGLFIVPTNLRYSFEANLLNTFEESELNEIKFSNLVFKDLIKYSDTSRDRIAKDGVEDISVLKINFTMQPSEVLYYLNHMNITEETLFGGLEGFSKSLVRHIVPNI